MLGVLLHPVPSIIRCMVSVEVKIFIFISERVFNAIKSLPAYLFPDSFSALLTSLDNLLRILIKDLIDIWVVFMKS